MSTGPQGVQGIQGMRGEQGIPGVNGATGSQGPRGANGGPTGPTGITGPAGVAGLTVSTYIASCILATNVSAAAVSIPFTAAYDPQGWVVNSGTTSMAFKPTIAGYYYITLSGCFSSASNNFFRVYNQSGTEIYSNFGPSYILCGSKVLYFNGSTDYITFQVGGGATLAGPNNGTFLNAIMLTIGNGPTGPAGTLNGTLTDTLSVQQIQETVVPSTVSGSGPVNYNWTGGDIFYVSGMTASFTANITNLPTTANKHYVIVFYLNQGSSAYYVNSLTIGGASTVILWAGGFVPTPAPNRIESQTFNLFYTGSAWKVMAHYTTFISSV